jgi:hypothetical protein
VDGAFRPFLLTWRIPVAPGRYRLHVEVVNREAGRSWQSERVVAAGGAMLSEPLVAAAAGAAPPSADAAPFHYSGARFVPAAGGAFEPSGTLYALFQLLVGAGGERRWEIEYVLAHTQDRTQRRTVLEEVDASEFRQGRLLKAKSLPLGGLPPGGYRLVINLREPGSPRVAASANAAFRIAETREERAVFVPGDPRSAAPEAARYLRALAAAVQ